MRRGRRDFESDFEQEGKLEELSGRPRWDMKECDF